ncbi:hypothetical protein EDI_221120 [Entamoeba dispar SAW760]|uniref:Uncharacterized protein n=1 Tax=Entamoeba dispar (strain ATCC PRA-260 / SAW760) TaxID=370354 RepID=B0EJN8_ENTDS|nr:uncharacterized protein EDI_221120 [Entamoeba dispar SAW760]EDR25263.1 hypothetical protein EDI_221120 [Entamoeba dispar SAW760]|eukprot:EDR25263.1 hypothetical protein EDI_221120 [Entamoeba dispar SAW760]
MLFCLASIFVASGVSLIFLIYFAMKNSQQLIASIAGSISWLIALSVIALIWLVLPFSHQHYVLIIYSFIITEVIRFTTLIGVHYFTKKFDEIKLVGLGLGVGAAVCQVLIHNVPYLLLSTGDADLYLLNPVIGNFTIVAFNGFCYSVYLICSYTSLSLLLHLNKKDIIYSIIFVSLHGAILIAGIMNYYVSVYLGITLMLSIDIITVIMTFIILYHYRH